MPCSLRRTSDFRPVTLGSRPSQLHCNCTPNALNSIFPLLLFLFPATASSINAAYVRNLPEEIEAQRCWTCLQLAYRPENRLLTIVICLKLLPRHLSVIVATTNCRHGMQQLLPGQGTPSVFKLDHVAHSTHLPNLDSINVCEPFVTTWRAFPDSIRCVSILRSHNKFACVHSSVITAAVEGNTSGDQPINYWEYGCHHRIPYFLATSLKWNCGCRSL